MPVAYDVLGFYGAVGVWMILLAFGIRRGEYRPFVGFGIVLLLFLNLRYFIEGQAAGIAFFIGIYDVFDNLGLSRNEGAPALASCADNLCSVWGERYPNHPSWGVAFYERFANGPNLRRNLLYGHIGCNSIAFVLMHYQLYRPGTGAQRGRHRIVGRVSFAALTVGTVFAVWLASEHRSVGEYGGTMAMLGFFSMSAFVYGSTLKGISTARRGDLAAHRTWMIRALGSMWGAFWLFRVLLIVTGPLLRNYESASLLISIWFSAPLGIAIAEYIRTRSSRSTVIDASTPPASVAV